MNYKRRSAHYNKNAIKLHASRCADPEHCFYGVPKTDPRYIALAEAMRSHHLKVCSKQIPCTCFAKFPRVDCMAAVNAENASAEIERHLAAIRKIKKKGRPLKGKEHYGIYPE